MTLRIHFTAEDLTRTRMASGVRPLLELSIGIRLLQETTHPVRFTAWRHLADAVEYAHQEFIAPYWPRIEQLHGADRALRVQQVADHGVERLLSDLNPRYLTWAPPVLHMTTASGRDGDITLGGRGLLLIPTVFGAHYPAFDCPDGGQPWITFPIRDGFRSALAPGALTAGALTEVPTSLRALLGRTRATVLCVMAEYSGRTIGQLAAHARISPAGAGEHASVLRNAGLAALTREGKRALHTLSPADACRPGGAAAARVGQRCTPCLSAPPATSPTP
ncbi:ArsR/SmtB family transcription factor [Streptomyces sp. RK9]|uniref:ArsR/SmtB family transcription factor n=1 Tax=Streptomyces sp. RK9 TaxID=3239284 RepID=UPI00386D997F